MWQAQYFCVVFRRRVAFSWRAQHFGDLHRHFAWQPQHFRCVLLRVFSESYHSQGWVKFGDNLRIAWQAWHVVTCDEIPHSTLLTFYTLHFSLHTPHPTLHSTLYTLHSTLYTLNFTLHTLHSTLYSPLSILYTLNSTLLTWSVVMNIFHLLGVTIPPD